MTENLKLSLTEPLIRPLVPPRAREANDVYWQLIEHLMNMATRGPEPALRQIRLAWWRDALGTLDAAEEPLDPLLQAVRRTLLTHCRAADLAATSDQLMAALSRDWAPDDVMSFGRRIFSQSAHLSEATANGGAAWGCVMTALCLDVGPGHPLWSAANAATLDSGPARALRALDRLARAIAARHGIRRRGREQVLVLRVGLIGR
jgi:hypothetical protein